MDKETQVLEMAKILCPKGTANCEKCSKNYKCDVKFSQLAKLVEAGCRKVADDEIVESMKTYERARQETAIEILHKIKDYIEDSVSGYLLIDRNGIRELANELGIKLED